MIRLTEQQQQTLCAAVNRIIPVDDYPGAWQSGVGDYLARQFERDLLPVLVPNFEAGVRNQRVLDAVERSSEFRRWESISQNV